MKGGDGGSSGQGLSIEVLHGDVTVVGRWGWIKERDCSLEQLFSLPGNERTNVEARFMNEESRRSDPVSSIGIGLNRQKPARFVVALPDVDGGP